MIRDEDLGDIGLSDNTLTAGPVTRNDSDQRTVSIAFIDTRKADTAVLRRSSADMSSETTEAYTMPKYELVNGSNQ